ncbi:MAG: DUF3050 domain-containing protein [Bacteriovoracaceae bacterium]|nr:DUF3050 domain-containing protein [Bacteriovoracaceae bacterium]
MFNQLEKIQSDLTKHPLFVELNSLDQVRLFMESHVWAVWDFMSLLKRLQRDVTCVEVPWKPSRYSSEMVRFINQIVLGEESDVDENGVAVSHFELYLQAMKEVGANTSKIENFMIDLDLKRLPDHARAFTSKTLATATGGSTIEVAASFFYGREKAIPGMFQGIVDVLKAENIHCPKLMYYLERHIHVDGEEHGPLSEKCLMELCQGQEELLMIAQQAGLSALQARNDFWNGVMATLKSGTRAGWQIPEFQEATREISR